MAYSPFYHACSCFTTLNFIEPDSEVGGNGKQHRRKTWQSAESYSWRLFDVFSPLLSY
jgi:hypothetical protein